MHIFEDTDTLISLLHIVTVHKLIRHNRVMNSLFDLMIIKVRPLCSELRLFSEKRHEVAGKRLRPSLCLRSHNLLKWNIDHAKIHFRDNICVRKNLIQHRKIRVLTF